MDSIDYLGHRPERAEAFSRDLLSEVHDDELQRLVVEASQRLSTPMALVTLVLDRVQFFKAHHGLPADLAAACGTPRDVSFCQLVVRDDAPFETADASSDSRVPQHLVQTYGIRAYLGMPIRVGQTVVGSLCVLDTVSRVFSDQDRNLLSDLAEQVTRRVVALSASRRPRPTSIAERAAQPALTELARSLEPIRRGVEAGLPALTAVRSYLKLSAHVLDGGEVNPEVLRRGLAAAMAATEDTEDLLCDLEAMASECEDGVVALQRLTHPRGRARLSDVLTAAQDLARGATRAAGGVPLPDLADDPWLHAPGPRSVALVATCLVSVAARLAPSAGGIRLDVARREDGSVELAVVAGLSATSLSEVEQELAHELLDDPTIRLEVVEGRILVLFDSDPRQGVDQPDHQAIGGAQGKGR